MKIICLGVVLLTPFVVTAREQQDTCLDKGKLRYIYQSKEQTIDSSYCFNQTRNSLYSKNCKENCIAKKIVRDYSHKKMDLFNSGVGSPGFTLCYEMKGEPQIVEFSDGKAWFKLDRCVFSKDNSYVDTGSLMKYWREEGERK
jgi:hypothetical protein